MHSTTLLTSAREPLRCAQRRRTTPLSSETTRSPPGVLGSSEPSPFMLKTQQKQRHDGFCNKGFAPLPPGVVCGVELAARAARFESELHRTVRSMRARPQPCQAARLILQHLELTHLELTQETPSP